MLKINNKRLLENSIHRRVHNVLKQTRPHFLAKFKANRNKLDQKRHRYSIPKTSCALRYIIKYR